MGMSALRASASSPMMALRSTPPLPEHRCSESSDSEALTVLQRSAFDGRHCRVTHLDKS